MELLRYSIPHRVAHDLESLVYVLLFLCSHLKGPGKDVRDPPLYGGGQNSLHPSGIQQWIRTRNPKTLGDVKYSNMIGHFDEDILPHISPYFSPLEPYISRLWNILFPGRLTNTTVGKNPTHSTATCREVIDIFKSALGDEKLLMEARNPPVSLGKRSRPGDLIPARNGWDAVEPTEKHFTAELKETSAPRRQRAFLGKGKRKVG
jgi:hypothetical protein